MEKQALEQIRRSLVFARDGEGGAVTQNTAEMGGTQRRDGEAQRGNIRR